MELLKAKDEHHINLMMPPVQANYMLELFYKSGMYLSGMNGAVRLTWSELQAYQLTTGKLSAWEAEALMDMSRCYVSMLYSGQEPDCPAPYTTDDIDVVERNRQRVASQIGSFKQSLASVVADRKKKPR